MSFESIILPILLPSRNSKELLVMWRDVCFGSVSAQSVSHSNPVKDSLLALFAFDSSE